MNLKIEISPGELADKITILEIKMARISDEKKLANIKKEHGLLKAVRDQNIPNTEAFEVLVAALKAVNLRLWQIEDDIRACEREKDFGPSFIALARSVYQNNDQRSEIKKKINTLLNSELFEEKSYAKYL